VKVLFICTHNRCRSIIAEAVTNHLSAGRITAKSAGIHPSGKVHPATIRYLNDAGMCTKHLTSQSWDEHEGWNPDIVITVCDSAHGEQCPVWFKKTLKIHWGLADPSKIEGSDKDIKRAFQNTISILTSRIKKLLDEGVENLSEHEKTLLLTKLGRQ